MTPTAKPVVAFLFIGGPHQVFHLAPVAAALAASRPDLVVECIYPDAETGAAVARVVAGTMVKLTEVRPPHWATWLAHTLARNAVTKLPLLLRLSRRLRDVAAIVTPERTSAILRRLGVTRSLLIHFRHGAGDRAPKSEARLRAFDLIVVPGAKDIARAVGAHGMPPERLRQTGYVKLDYLSRLPAAAPRLFDNDRPTVVYNPHFDASVSSWPWADAIVAAFAAQDRYNLVVAPHLRIGQDMNAVERAEWQALALPGRILIDLDSPRLIDMTYTRGGDIYLGDMSSQLYEFLVVPRPVVFVDAHDAAWQDDPRYAGWHLGEVASSVAGTIPAIDRARAMHPGLVERQRAAVVEAFGDYHGASARGATIIAEAVDRRSGRAAHGGTLADSDADMLTQTSTKSPGEA